MLETLHATSLHNRCVIIFSFVKKRRFIFHYEI